MLDPTLGQFAQRLVSQALAQSEPLQLNADQEREWQSIFQYRLWEVRQKILLYPENWLRFGRHLHKSPECEVLERSRLADQTLSEAREQRARLEVLRDSANQTLAELEREISIASGEPDPPPETKPALPSRFTRKSSGWK